MSDWAILAYVAVALYGFECLSWIEAAGVACFNPLLGRHWKARQGAALPGNERGGLALLDPMSLGGSLVVCHRWPLCMSPDGLANVAVNRVASYGTTRRYIPFEDIHNVRAEFGDIHINGARFARVSS